MLGTDAYPSPGFRTIKSKPTDDLILEIWLPNTNLPIPSSSTIRYDWLTVTNRRMKVDLLKEEYFCHAEMFDSASNAMPLRPRFSKLGKHFFDLKYPASEQTSSEITNCIRLKPLTLRDRL
jgi:hypothetical protein